MASCVAARKISPFSYNPTIKTSPRFGERMQKESHQPYYKDKKWDHS